jgi:hypothetical protein
MTIATALTALFVAALIVGLLLAVRAMLLGVERRRKPLSAQPAPIPTVRFSTPVVSAFATAFGAAGYLFTRPGRIGLAAGTIGALLIGALAGAFAVRLVRRAAAFVPEHDPDDPRYVLQGHLATVTAPIEPNSDGEITYVSKERATQSALADWTGRPPRVESRSSSSASRTTSRM